MKAIITISDNEKNNYTGNKKDNEILENFLNKTKSAMLVVGRVQSGKTKFILKICEQALNGSCNAAFVLAGSNNWLHSQTASRIKEKTAYQLEDIRDKIFSEIPQAKTIFTSLKTIKSIEKLYEIIVSSAKSKIIIVDDESDFATINSASLPHEKTAIHKLLHKIYDQQKKILYVSVTATPYADIVSRDSFDFEDQLFHVEPGEQYTGLKEFRQENKYEIVNADSYITINENYQNWWNVILDHAQRVMASKTNASQLLINISVRNEDHFKLKKFLIDLKQRATNHVYFFKNQREISDEIFAFAQEVLSNIAVFNQDDDSRKDVNASQHQVVIGGELLSRGYTFEAPVTCMMFNSAESSLQLGDTLTQRARWFGYRRNTKDGVDIFTYMKIYVTKRVYEGYLEAEKLNQIIFENNSIKGIREKILEEKLFLIKPTGKVARNG